MWSRRFEHGSVMLEAAVVLPLLLALVLVIIDLARISAETAFLDNAASQALDLARVTPDLDADTTSAGLTAQEISDNQVKYDAAVNRVQTQLTTWSKGEFFGTFTVKKLGIPGYPTPSNGQTREEALTKQPIELEITKDFSTSYPLSMFVPTITLTGRAVGYREPRGYQTEPTPLDCAGNVIKAGVTPSTTGCKCPSSDHPAAVYNFNAKACNCRGNAVYTDGTNGSKGSCSCPGLSVNISNDPTTMNCSCPLSTATCLVTGQVFNSAACRCDSCTNYWQATASGCNSCPSDAMQLCFDQNKTFIPSWCGCNQPCYNGSTLDPTNPAYCKCTAAANSAVIGTRQYFDWECRVYDCCGGAAVCDLRSTGDGRTCNCPPKPSTMVCNPGEAYARVGNECKCACSNGGIWMNDGQGHAMCADPVCKTKQCSWNESAGKFTPSE